MMYTNAPASRTTPSRMKAIIRYNGSRLSRSTTMTLIVATRNNASPANRSGRTPFMIPPVISDSANTLQNTEMPPLRKPCTKCPRNVFSSNVM